MTVLSKIAIATVVASSAVSAVETKKKGFGELELVIFMMRVTLGLPLAKVKHLHFY